MLDAVNKPENPKNARNKLKTQIVIEIRTRRYFIVYQKFVQYTIKKPYDISVQYDIPHKGKMIFHKEEV